VGIYFVYESDQDALESAGVGWQRIGVCAKRLEKGRFHWPVGQEGRLVTMRAEELAMLDRQSVMIEREAGVEIG
jgi:transposase